MEHQRILNLVIDEVVRAGEFIKAEWERPTGPRGSGDKADVDVEIETVLRTALLNILDCDFWGEETGSKLDGAEYCWVVDPNDGTVDFLNGLKGSAVSVGLIFRGTPVLGVVYAPVTESVGPDCIAWTQGMNAIYRNGRLIRSSLINAELKYGSKVLVSSAARLKHQVNARLCYPAHPVPTTSVAYRLAAVAAGDAVAGLSLVPTSAHDLVAGHAILLGAGGVLVDEKGESITYDSVERLAVTSQRCFGGASSACQELITRDWSAVFKN